MQLAAGVDFGGTSAKVGIVDRGGRLVGRAHVTLDPSRSFEETVDPVAQAIRTLVDRHASGARLCAIGIGTPGFIDKSDGRLVGGCNNIPVLQKRSVQAYLEAAFHVPAFADNDATCAAAGELLFGAGRRFSHFVLITLGTAIGGGLVLDGRVYRGARGFAGEIGHLCVNPRGLWCDCGSRGCFEMYASAKAIARAYRERLLKRDEPAGPEVDSQDVVERAAGGDRCARDTIEEAGEWIAQVFGGLLNVLDLQAFLVGGGVSEAGEALLEPIRRRLPDYCWPHLARGVSVQAATLHNDAGILGAAAQAFERLPVGVTVPPR